MSYLLHNHATSDFDCTDEEWEFLKAMEEFKRVTGRRHPTFTEVLGVAKHLGYAKRDASRVS